MPKQKNPLERPAPVSSPDEGGVERAEKDIEAEAAVDTGSTERRKIQIPAEMDTRTIQERFGVSRTTAWRAKERGWLFYHYREKLVMPDSIWANENAELLRRVAREGCGIALARLAKNSSEIRPFEFDDLVSSAYVRLMELSGHPDRENENWLKTVARNAALDFIKTEVIAGGKVFSSEDYVDETKERITREEA